MAAMNQYAELIEPWASRVATQMLEAVDISNLRSWTRTSRVIGAELRKEYTGSAQGAAAREMHAENVKLITSIPREAAQRAQELTREAMLGGRRPDEAAREIARTTGVSESQATLIARTESAKANATFTQARAQAIGAERYWWRTMDDEAVRESHRAMGSRSNSGETFLFDPPPEVDTDFDAHNPGEVPNCRCYAEPVIPGVDDTE
jgi:SPP1 gp7 family putative phage head morphogenesis protein